MEFPKINEPFHSFLNFSVCNSLKVVYSSYNKFFILSKQNHPTKSILINRIKNGKKWIIFSCIKPELETCVLCNASLRNLKGRKMLRWNSVVAFGWFRLSLIDNFVVSIVLVCFHSFKNSLTSGCISMRQVVKNFVVKSLSRCWLKRVNEFST